MHFIGMETVVVDKVRAGFPAGVSGYVQSDSLIAFTRARDCFGAGTELPFHGIVHVQRSSIVLGRDVVSHCRRLEAILSA